SAFPNPMVGAVLISAQQEVIASGWHAAPGLAHAEREALLKIDTAPENSTLYVTLEPCCTFGRTPPCTSIILEKKIRRVVVGMLDPDVRMSGKGVDVLRAAGVEVCVGVLESECRLLNRRYLDIRKQKRPTVALKSAFSLDGRTASSFGESKWITGERTRLQSHGLRSIYDGILIGSGTLLADDPSLNCRMEGGRDPIPIVLDTNLRCPTSAKVLHAGRKPILCCGQQAPKRTEMESFRMDCSLSNGRIDLATLLPRLYQKGIYTLLVEGGATVAKAFLEQGFVDILELYVGSQIIGSGKNWCDLIPRHLSDAIRFRLRGVNQLDSDVHLSYLREIGV
ncbi:MAG: bifunctional diaminohydroxyphosphoribosylaminopyrimidine deaminase/5-amino-6-(5-phosphoribosylamino)uracil reductase RibD, partial [Myxococcota bacterium]|nr:bifunctional diaminohydroxyphosphoribosylaminopyrimidine deaminase/5-amino-6-(5-phosphoribosylamino)uracil reductase RibD [Myxococcota bacterium]